MEFEQLVAQRRSVKRFDPGHSISDAELKSLFEQVVLTPSSFNLQHWRFVVVRGAENKAKLRQAAMDQEQVEQASATLVVIGKLDAHTDAATIYADTPPEVRDDLVPMIEQFYADKPQLQRDEAVRSVSLAAMTLMFAASDMGYATSPMIGFDPQAVGDLIGLDANHIPVLLIAIGKQVGDLRPRSARLPVNEVVRLETMRGPGLA